MFLSRKIQIFPLFAGFFIVAITLLMISSLNQTTQTNSKAAATPDRVDLFLETSSNQVNLNQTFTVNVVMDSNIHVSGGHFTIEFDPVRVRGVSLTNTGALPVNLQGPTVNNNNMTATFGAQTGNARQGRHIIATATFQSLGQNGATNIQIRNNGTTEPELTATEFITGQTNRTNFSFISPLQVSIGSSPPNSPRPTQIPQPTQPTGRVRGDCNGNGSVDLNDFNDVVRTYGTTVGVNTVCDFNNDGRVGLRDFNAVMMSIVNGSPTGQPQPTNPPLPTSITLPTIVPGRGIWISNEELQSRPMSGNAWQNTLSMAQSSWGSPCLHDNNCEHDVKTMSGALVAARTGDAAMRTKVITALNAAINRNSQTSRALELSRGLQSYVIAADIIGYRTAEFEDNLRYLLNKSVSGHSGGTGVIGTAKKSANNWGMHARASAIAAALYLNDQSLIQQLVAAHNDIIGISHSEISYTGTNWHADTGNKAGINRAGATIQGKRVSGVIPEDWRRAADFKWPPSTSGYMWEGMQGFTVEAILLARAGLVPFEAASNPLKRAFDILYGQGEAAANSPVYINRAASDDTFLPWLANYYLGTNYPTDSAKAGKGICCTDWTHVR